MIYHINDRGEPGRCSATQGKCPYGSSEAHYTSAEAARVAYEKLGEALPPPALKQSREQVLVEKLSNLPLMASHMDHLRSKKRWTNNERDVLISTFSFIAYYKGKDQLRSVDFDQEARSFISGLHFAKETLSKTERHLLEALEEAQRDFQAKWPDRIDSASSPEQLNNYFRHRNPGVELFMSQRHGILNVSTIKVLGEKRKGLGSKAMADIVKAADKQGWKIALTPSTSQGSSKAGLERFYRRFGFVPNKGRHKDFQTTEAFIREPQTS